EDQRLVEVAGRGYLAGARPGEPLRLQRLERGLGDPQLRSAERLIHGEQFSDCSKRLLKSLVNTELASGSGSGDITNAVMNGALASAACGCARGRGAAPATAAPAVTNTNDSGPGSLRSAIGSASNGDTISIPAGTYSLTTGPIQLNTNLTIVGEGEGRTTISG